MPSSPPLPPRCLSCAYVLAGLDDDGLCPECGRSYNLSYPSTYTTRPPFIAWIFWLPGLIQSIGIGFLLTLVLIFGLGNWGYALWLTVPFSVGSILGYRYRCSWVVAPILIIALALALILGFVSLSLAGAFCGLTLSAIFIGPIAIGMFMGYLLRSALKQTRFPQRGYLPVLLLALPPIIVAAVEGPAGPGRVEAITTTRVIAGTPMQCWDGIVFYEEVTHKPPLLLRIGLFRPIRTEGSCTAEGDRKACTYNKGRLTKQVTQVAPGRRLAFDVVEQEMYRRDVLLTGGSFDFTPVDAGHTRVTLTTSYRPLLTPRWCWRPFERLAAHTLHGHILEGMRRRVESVPVTSIVPKITVPGITVPVTAALSGRGLLSTVPVTATLSRRAVAGVIQ